jgi:DNA-binding CsgD family transcriptional regulator
MLSPHQWQSIHEIALAIHRSNSVAEAIDACHVGLTRMLTGGKVEMTFEENTGKEVWTRKCHYSHLLFSRNIDLPGKKDIVLQIRYAESPPPTDSRIFHLITEHLISAIAHLPSLSSTQSIESPLSRREQQVFPLIITGRANEEIAGLLGISARTVEKHVASILGKTGLDNRKLLIASFQRQAI